MALSILALLTACSSSEEKRMDTLEVKLDAMEQTTVETMDMLSNTEAMMIGGEVELAAIEKKAQAMNTFLNPNSVFSEGGIEIIEEAGVPTLITGK